MNLYLFGEPRLEYQGEKVVVERRKALALLAYLALAERPLGRDVVCATLWPEQDQNHARAALRSTLSALASLIPEDALDKGSGTLALNHEIFQVDVNTFLKLLSRSRAHNHLPSQVCEECAPLLDQAVDLYQSDFLEGFSLPGCSEFDDWQRVQSEWLRRELSHTLGRLVIYYRTHGNFEAAFRRAHQWLELDRLHEPAHRELMRLYAATGQRAEALRQYQQCVELLDTELATIPEDETTQIYQALQSNRMSQLPAGFAAGATVSGILPALPPLIVGRETALRDIKARLNIPPGSEARPITVIQGWPGVGKSTIVAALAHDPDVVQTFTDGVLWASLGETPNILAELTGWADALMGSDREQERTIEDVSAQLTALLRDRNMLILLDDVWKTEHAAPFRVGGKSCAMILTSRLNGVAQELAPTAGDLYRLPILEDQAALDLLAKLAPETVSRYPDEAFQLIHDLEGLPLALQVAGRLLHSEAHLGWDIGDLLAELRAGSRLLESRAPSDMAGAVQDTPPTIATLLKRSTDSLDALTRRRFASLGLFVPKPATFGLEAMAVAWDVEDARPTTRILVGRGLLEPVSGGRFQMHGLLVLHARSLLAEV